MKDKAILIDANVWVDYFVNRSSKNKDALALISKSYASDSCLLCTPITSVNNIYYAIRQYLKQEAREDEEPLDEEVAKAANEIAWACLATLRKLSFIVPADENDMIEASILKGIHFDYEDNLVAAAAKRVGAEYIVTSDEQMLARQPYPCRSLVDALAD